MNYLEHPQAAQALDAVKAVRGSFAEAHTKGINVAAKVLELAYEESRGQNPLDLTAKIVAAYEQAVAESLGNSGAIPAQTVRL